MSLMVRKTQQREAIRKAISSAGRPLSPEEIHRAARRHAGGLGIATVYRTIKSFVDGGVLATVDVPGEAPRYELAGKSHHHHFFCRRCDRVYEMEGCPGALKDLAPRGFTVQGHEVILYGLCADCGKR